MNDHRRFRSAPVLRHAFSLVEVVVATTVMALMMISLLSFVQFAGQAWERSQMTINLTSEANLVLDFIERELAESVGVDSPVAGQPATYTLRYGKRVYDGVSMPMASFTFEVAWPYAWTGVATSTLMTRVITGDARYASSTWGTGFATADNTLVVDRYNFELGRHISSFTVQRSGSRKLVVSVLVQVNREEDEAAQTLLLERTMFVH